MMRDFFIVLILVSIVAPSRGEDLTLDGQQFLTHAAIRWEDTNTLPTSLMVYKVVPQKFDSTVISNAMKIGEFKSLNKVSSPKGTVWFQDKKDARFMTRYLKIFPEAGSMNYYDRHAEGSPARNVPSFEEAESLAVSYLQKFGIEKSQIIEKPRPRSQTETSVFSKQGGEEVRKEITMRGIILFRQVNGIQVAGNYFLINFCNDGKPSMFELRWPKLVASKEFQAATRQEITILIQNGKTVNPIPDSISPGTREITIKNTSIHYFGRGDADRQKMVFPFVVLDIATDQGIAQLHCPILSSAK